MKISILSLLLVSNISFAADKCRSVTSAEVKANLAPACKVVQNRGFFYDFTVKGCEEKSKLRRICKSEKTKLQYIDATMKYGKRDQDLLDCRFQLNEKNKIISSDCSYL